MAGQQRATIRWVPMMILALFLVLNLILGVFYVFGGEKFPIEIRLREITAPLEVHTDGAEYPTIHIKSEAAWPTVTLVAETCSDADTTVDAELSWRNTEPAGFSESRGNFINQLTKGCFRNESQLSLLDDSRVRIREQAAIGNKRTVWEVVGIVAALNPDGTTGKFITWTSNKYVVVYDL